MAKGRKVRDVFGQTGVLDALHTSTTIREIAAEHYLSPTQVWTGSFRNLGSSQGILR